MLYYIIYVTCVVHYFTQLKCTLHNILAMNCTRISQLVVEDLRARAQQYHKFHFDP